MNDQETINRLIAANENLRDENRRLRDEHIKYRIQINGLLTELQNEYRIQINGLLTELQNANDRKCASCITRDMCHGYKTWMTPETDEGGE